MTKITPDVSYVFCVSEELRTEIDKSVYTIIF
jgi:hypothetical protein